MALPSPAMLVLLVMTVAPTLFILYSSVRSDTILGGAGTFVGLDNFVTALTDPSTLHAFWVTLLFVAVVVILEMVLGLALAIPLSRQSAASKVAATLMLLPFAITPVVASMIFKQLLNPNYGWIPYYLQLLGAPPHLDLLGDPTTAWLVLIVFDLWEWTPFICLILMAGLQAAPVEPREAAMVDGATTWQLFRHITLPALTPFLAIALVLRVIQAFKTFDSFKTITRRSRRLDRDHQPRDLPRRPADLQHRPRLRDGRAAARRAAAARARHPTRRRPTRRPRGDVR